MNLVQISRNVDKTFEKSEAALAFRLEILVNLVRLSKNVRHFTVGLTKSFYILIEISGIFSQRNDAHALASGKFVLHVFPVKCQEEKGPCIPHSSSATLHW